MARIGRKEQALFKGLVFKIQLENLKTAENDVCCTLILNKFMKNNVNKHHFFCLKLGQRSGSSIREFWAHDLMLLVTIIICT